MTSVKKKKNLWENHRDQNKLKDIELGEVGRMINLGKEVIKNRRQKHRLSMH